MEECVLYSLIRPLFEYIKNNSIDFIAMIASIFIALETDKFINWKRAKKDKSEIANAIFNELSSLKISLSVQAEQSKSQINHGTLLLKLVPYNYPYWNSIQNTDRIELFADNLAYSDTITFYSELEILNQWESVQTKYILFNNSNDQYLSSLVELISLQRIKCLKILDQTINKFKERNKK